MQVTTKTPESQVKIRFPDCDPYNHLNNSRYIDYMINAREDQLLQFYGFDVHRYTRENKTGWLIGQNQIAYLVPASLMETVTITSQLLYADQKSLLLEVMMWNEDKTQLKALLWTRFIHVDLVQQKSHLHSEELMQFLKQIEHPLPEPMGFEDRVKSLRPSR